MMKFMRRFKDLGITGLTAKWYDKNSRGNRIEEMRDYAKEAAKHLGNGACVLEVASGPGHLAIELAKLGSYKIIGLDISKDFVHIAQSNAKEAGVKVEFQQGNAAEIPFPDNMFNFIICTAAFKNFKEPVKALSEMYRVLKPGTTALYILIWDRNVSDQQLDNYTKEMNVTGIEALFMKLTFKYFLKKGAYSKDEFISLISKTSFNKYDIKEIGIALYVYLQK